ncbi:MAG: transglycosylase domain-containing protein, partial [Gemmobacter sp.]|uniref:transglycosylase domain-containing protein n=1 Tax=Gemmobacter sp. TaxID=1898957 RepID=UPI001A3BB9EE
WVIAGTLTKTEILNLFVHQPHYWGRDCYGIEAAAQVYFGKTPARLDLHEAAFLASVIYQPSRIDDRAWGLRRRNMLLSMMAEKGVILPQEARQAMARPLGLSDRATRCPPIQDATPEPSGPTSGPTLRP